MDASRIYSLQIHTVELLEQALNSARSAGYTIREEMIGGRAGAACVIRGRKWLFLDPAAPPREQLHQVVEVLRNDPATSGLVMSDALRRVLDVRLAS